MIEDCRILKFFKAEEFVHARGQREPRVSSRPEKHDFLLLAPSWKLCLGTPRAAFGQAPGCGLGPQEQVCNLEGEVSRRGGGGVGEMPNEILRRTFISYSITSVTRKRFTLNIYI